MKSIDIIIIYEQNYPSSFMIEPKTLLRVNFMQKVHDHLSAKLSVLIQHLF